MQSAMKRSLSRQSGGGRLTDWLAVRKHSHLLSLMRVLASAAVTLLVNRKEERNVRGDSEQMTAARKLFQSRLRDETRASGVREGGEGGDVLAPL